MAVKKSSAAPVNWIATTLSHEMLTKDSPRDYFRSLCCKREGEKKRDRKRERIKALKHYKI